MLFDTTMPTIITTLLSMGLRRARTTACRNAGFALALPAAIYFARRAAHPPETESGEGNRRQSNPQFVFSHARFQKWRETTHPWCRKSRYVSSQLEPTAEAAARISGGLVFNLGKLCDGRG